MSEQVTPSWFALEKAGSLTLLSSHSIAVRQFEYRGDREVVRYILWKKVSTCAYKTKNTYIPFYSSLLSFLYLTTSAFGAFGCLFFFFFFPQDTDKFSKLIHLVHVCFLFSHTNVYGLDPAFLLSISRGYVMKKIVCKKNN